MGYILLDPSAGAGAYRIGGGENGGIVKFINENSGILSGLAIFLGFFTVSVPLVGPLAMIGLFIGLMVVYSQIVHYITIFKSSPNASCLKFGGIDILGYLAAFLAILALIKWASALVAEVSNFIAGLAISGTICKEND